MGEWVSKEDKALAVSRVRSERLTSRRGRSNFMADLAHGTVLKPWMMAYAEWLVSEPVPPPVKARRAKMGLLTKVQAIHQRAVGLLEDRPDFIAYLEELERGPVEQARAKFRNRLPSYIDAHAEALEAAQAARDYRAMAQISELAIDRVFPKQQTNVSATQVNITLQPIQQKMLDSIDTTIEVLDADVVEPDETPS